MARLITIPISHYCEKARWALDRSKIPYREIRHLQLFHYLPAWLAGKGHTVPVLALGDGRAISDSTGILRWVDDQAPGSLYPRAELDRAEVLRLEDRFDEELGPATRRFVYFHILDRKEILHYNGAGTPRFEQAALAIAFPLAARYIRRRLNVERDVILRDLDGIRRVFDEIGGRVEGRRYLVGDRFTAADLTFASMASPMLVPAEYGSPLPRLDELPPALREVVEELRVHPAGVYALRLFREERRAEAEG
jgi:glutathione S-transferase